jgi:trans-aconitate methyltransferase
MQAYRLRMLDVGCADGALAVRRLDGVPEFLKSGVALHGIDPSQESIDAAKKNFPSRVYSWEVTDTSKLVRKRQKYDIVWTSRVVHRMPVSPEFLKSCWSLVDFGGLLVIVFPDDRHTLVIPNNVDLSWMLHAMGDVPGMSMKYSSESIIEAASELSPNLEVRMLNRGGAPSPDETEAMFDWRLNIVRGTYPERLASCEKALADFRALADVHRGLLLYTDTALILQKT